jgi:hypothetical protein
VRQVLVQWKDQPATSPTWEDYDTFSAHFPTFQLEDELVFDSGRDVMCGRTYAKRRRNGRRPSRQPRRRKGRRVARKEISELISYFLVRLILKSRRAFPSLLG